MLVFRIFRQIPAKTGLEIQCLWGFPEGTVEMQKARSCITTRNHTAGSITEYGQTLRRAVLLSVQKKEQEKRKKHDLQHI